MSRAASDELGFCWYAPTHGDGRIIGGRAPDLLWSPAYISEVATEAEAAGFDSILLPIGPSCADPIVTAAHIGQETNSLRSLIAIRPGSMPPTVLQKSLSTLDHLTGGRVSVNIVTGGAPAELAMDGDFEPHNRRYERTREYVELLRAVSRENGVNRTGEFFSVRDATLSPKPLQRGGIPIFVGGASQGAIDVAAEYGDVYLMWGETCEAVGRQLSLVRARATSLGRTIRCGMRINLIVGATTEEAWEQASYMLASVDSEMAQRAETYIADSDSHALHRIQALRNSTDATDPAFWTGMVPYRSGNSTALVGSPADIVSSLRRYMAAGVDEFIFSSYPHIDTVRRIGEEVLAVLRRH